MWTRQVVVRRIRGKNRYFMETKDGFVNTEMRAPAGVPGPSYLDLTIRCWRSLCPGPCLVLAGHRLLRGAHGVAYRETAGVWFLHQGRHIEAISLRM